MHGNSALPRDGSLNASHHVLHNLSHDDTLINASTPVKVRVVQSAPTSTRASPVVHLAGGRHVALLAEAQQEMLQRSHSGFQGTLNRKDLKAFDTKQTNMTTHVSLWFSGAPSGPPSPGFGVSQPAADARRLLRPASAAPQVNVKTAQSPGMLVHTQTCEKAHQQLESTLRSTQGARRHPSYSVSGTAKYLAFTPQPELEHRYEQHRNTQNTNDDASSVASSAIESTVSSGRFSAAVASALLRQPARHSPAAPATHVHSAWNGVDRQSEFRPAASATPGVVSDFQQQKTAHPSGASYLTPAVPKEAEEGYTSKGQHEPHVEAASADMGPALAQREGTSGEPRSHSAMGGDRGGGSPGATPPHQPRNQGRDGRHDSLAHALAQGGVRGSAVVAAAATSASGRWQR